MFTQRKLYRLYLDIPTTIQFQKTKLEFVYDFNTREEKQKKNIFFFVKAQLNLLRNYMR